MKYCKYCNSDKEDSEFYKGCAKCKSCKVEYQRKYCQENSEKIKEYKKKYRSENYDEIKKVLADYYKNNSETLKEKSKNNYSNNRDRKIEYQKKYVSENKKKVSEYKAAYQRNRRNNDPIFKLKFSISRMIRNSLKNKGFIKYKKSKEILGCSIEDFKKYIENKFDESMNWENYGKVWDLDHIIPLSTAETEEDVIRLNYYTNLQPLDSHINRNIKRDRIDYK